MMYVHPFVLTIEWDHSIQVGVEPIIIITKYSGRAYDRYNISECFHKLSDMHICLYMRSSERIYYIILV